jgi:hypothetical protein
MRKLFSSVVFRFLLSKRLADASNRKQATFIFRLFLHSSVSSKVIKFEKDAFFQNPKATQAYDFNFLVLFKKTSRMEAYYKNFHTCKFLDKQKRWSLVLILCNSEENCYKMMNV